MHDDPARVKLEFFGKALFIPSFFVVTGLVIDPVVFAKDVVDHFGLALGIVVALLVGKWIAAAVGARLFGYTPAARSTMGALTLPQVAATLAAAVVAFDMRKRGGAANAGRHDAQRGARIDAGHVHSRADALRARHAMAN